MPDETKKSGQRVDRRAPRRDIIRWTPAKTELLTLGLIYALKQKKIPIPWDEAAAFVEEKCSGGAAEQHIAKIRKRRIAEGEPVPPLVGRHNPVSRNARPRKDQISSTTPETPRKLRSRNANSKRNKIVSSGSSGFDPEDAADSDADYELSRSFSWGSVNKRRRSKKSSYSQISDNELSSPESPLKRKKITRNTYSKGRTYVDSGTEVKSEDEEDAPRPSARKTVPGYSQSTSREVSDTTSSIKSETSGSSENDGVSCTEKRMVILQIQPHRLAQVNEDGVHFGSSNDSMGLTYAPRNPEYSNLRNSKFDDVDAQGYVPEAHYSTLPYDYIPRHEDELDYVPQTDLGTTSFNHGPQPNLQTSTYPYPPFGNHEGVQDSYALYPQPHGVTHRLQESPYFPDHLVNYTYPPERNFHRAGEHSHSFSSNAESDYGSAIDASQPIVTYGTADNRSSTMEQSFGYYNSFGNGLRDNNHGLGGFNA